MIETSDKRGSGKFVLAEQHDNEFAYFKNANYKIIPWFFPQN